AGEFDGETGEGRLVRAGQVADHEILGLDVAIGDVGEDVGVEVAGENRLDHHEATSDWASISTRATIHPAKLTFETAERIASSKVGADRWNSMEVTPEHIPGVPS